MYKIDRRGEKGVEMVQKIVWQDRPIDSVHWKEILKNKLLCNFTRN